MHRRTATNADQNYYVSIGNATLSSEYSELATCSQSLLDFSILHHSTPTLLD